jgi:hypothetical protein
LKLLNNIPRTDELEALLAVGQWDSAAWRLDNLYKGISEDGVEFDFRMNDEQRNLLSNLWYRNVILKARQLGFTTFIDLIGCDGTLFSSNFTATIIADTGPNAIKIFEKKVIYPFEHLPGPLYEYFKSQIVTKTKSELTLKNGSSIYAGLSPRGGTNQFLHISEFGRICKKFPAKGDELMSGGLGSVHQNGFVFIESTADGSAGPFYNTTMTAKKLQDEGARLAHLQFRLHFYPWYLKKSYRVTDQEVKDVPLSANTMKYFEKLEAEHGIQVDDNQKVWYHLTEESLQSAMRREHPSYPEEAFEVAVEGAIYERQLTKIRQNGQIDEYPWDASRPVNTFWDFGVADKTSIWFHQLHGMKHVFIRYFEDSGQGLDHYWKKMNEFGYTWGTHYLPHDADARQQTDQIVTKRKILEKLGVRNITVVTRVADIKTGIELVRQRLPMASFDKTNTVDGISCLDSYCWEWDKHRGTWMDKPLHNWASHGADALRVWAEGFTFSTPRPPSGRGARTQRDSWRTI